MSDNTKEPDLPTLEDYSGTQSEHIGTLKWSTKQFETMYKYTDTSQYYCADMRTSVGVCCFELSPVGVPLKGAMRRIGGIELQLP